MAARPNLMYVFADQLRRQSCGYAGDIRARTPSIDLLAAEGMDLRQAISGSPMCAPYRASLFTGKYSSSTGMVINELRMNPAHDCMGHVLGRAGYDLVYIGKWHLFAAMAGGHERGENQFVPPGPHRLGFDGFWAGYNFWHNYYRAFYYGDDGRRVTVEGYEPDRQTELALRWLESGRQVGRPFALFLSYGTPHDPWTPANVPAAYLQRFRDIPFPPPRTYAAGSAEYWNPRKDRQWWLDTVGPNLEGWQRIYAAMTANLDWNVGRLLRGLDRMGLGEDTLVVFTSDHGEMFGAHGRIAKNIFYEEAVRVPFLMRWPGRVPASGVSDVLLNTPDIMPTLLSLLGVPIPTGVEGLNLARAARGLPGPEPDEALLQGMGATFLWEDGYEWRALRDRRFTYAIARVDGREYLFDRVADPLQARNLASEAGSADVLARYRAALHRRLAALGDTFEACTWYRDHWTRDRVILRSATFDASN